MVSSKEFNKHVPIILDIPNARYIPRKVDEEAGQERKADDLELDALQLDYDTVAYDTKRNVWVVGIAESRGFADIPSDDCGRSYINYISFRLTRPDLERIVGKTPQGPNKLFLERLSDEREVYFDPFDKKWIYKNKQELPSAYPGKLWKHLTFTVEESIRDSSPKLKSEHSSDLALYLVRAMTPN